MTSRPQFSTAHLSLGSSFYDPVKPASFPSHQLRYRNQPAAASVGLDTLGDAQWLDHFGRFTRLHEDAQPEPLALRYHGHQFQHYNPDLGDGRGFLFAQLHELVPQRGTSHRRLLDLGTKGSGTTPYSRAGDGRLTLKGAVREALATALLSAFGVNTSKTLSIIETGEALMRGDEPSPTRAAVLVRLNHSHIRFGTFQRLSFEGNVKALERLVEHCLVHYYPHAARTGESGRDALTLLTLVVEAKAKTVAQWMAAGFVHGVLNTDNMNITGESFDYGPYRFLPQYDPGFTAAYFDHSGLYAFGRQPSAVMWNLQQLAGTLTHFADQQALVGCLKRFSDCLESEITTALFARFGVAAPMQQDTTLDLDTANALLTDFFQAMRETQLGYQAPFFDLFGGGAEKLRHAQDGPRGQAYRHHSLANALAGILALPSAIDSHGLDEVAKDNDVPDLQIGQIEQLWSQIVQDDDWSGFHQKLAAFQAIETAKVSSATPSSAMDTKAL